MRIRVAVAVALVALGAASCGGSKSTTAESPNEYATTAPAAAAAVTGTLQAADQSSDGTTLTVASVSITGAPGFIAVHQDLNGQPGPVVGHAPVKEGSNQNVVVKLDSKQKTGKFWPMLHVDKGQIGVYEFPGADTPVTSGSDVVMKQITLTVM